MKGPTLTRELARRVDQLAVDEYGMSSLVLMENAGRGVADKLFQFGITGPVVICCGKGNNGGDGFVIARHLDLRYVTVKVLLWCKPEELTGDAKANFEILRKSEVPLFLFEDKHEPDRLNQELRSAGWIVDALLGTGSRGEPRKPLDDVIRQLNRADAPIVAVDLPSGLDCDSGLAAEATIRARHTCTFVGRKRGFDQPGADEYTGVVHVVDIGAPRTLVEQVMRQAELASSDFLDS